jgi:hypothetical protein
MQKKTALNRREAAQTTLAEITKTLAELQTERNMALIDGAEAKAIAKFDGEIATLKQAEQTERDRIGLLESEVAKAKQENVAKQQEGHLTRFSKLQTTRVGCAKKVQQGVADLWKDISELVELSERARTGYAVHSQSATAGADSMDGAAMSDNAIMDMLAHEFFRVSWVPFRGGRAGERTPRALPGSKCPKLEWQLTPEKVMPFVERIKLASEFAVETLKKEIRAPGKNNVPRTVQVPAAVNGAEPRPRTEAELRLSDLLNQQAAVANDITEAGETKYKAIVAEIVATTAEIEAWRTETKSAEPRPAA